jgi:hypothetical protein
LNPVPDFQAVSGAVFVWHAYDPAVRADCSSTAVRTPEGFVLIDPIPLAPSALERMVGPDRIAAILLTSGNHERACSSERTRLGVPVLAPGESGLPADGLVAGGDRLFGAIDAVALPGGGPGETAYVFASTLIFGDAVVHLDGLEILPDKYCTDPARLRTSLRALADWSFDTVCFAHGSPLRGEEARPAILGLLT